MYSSTVQRLAYRGSHSVSCLFILMVVSFIVQKLFSLMESHLLFFGFVSLSFGVRTTKTNTDVMKVTIYVFIQKFFIVSGLTLKSLIHFGLVSVSDVRQWSSFFFFNVSVQIFPVLFIERLLFFHCSCLFHRLIVIYECVYF